jgi:adenosylhomocysteine nucleosidase
MTDILILAALSEEADAVLSGTGQHEKQQHLNVRHMSQGGRNLAIACTGIGKVNAALAFGLLHTPDVKLVLMVGTCGRIGAGKNGAYWISHAVQHDYGALRPDGFKSYRAGDWPMGDAGPQHFTPIADPGLGLPHAGIVSGDVFLQCSETAAHLSQQHQAALIDMEVASVAQAAAALGVPWAAIKAVTDDANGESVDDFSSNLADAARQAALAAEQFIALL